MYHFPPRDLIGFGPVRSTKSLEAGLTARESVDLGIGRRSPFPSEHPRQGRSSPRSSTPSCFAVCWSRFSCACACEQWKSLISTTRGLGGAPGAITAHADASTVHMHTHTGTCSGKPRSSLGWSCAASCDPAEDARRERGYDGLFQDRLFYEQFSQPQEFL